VRACKDVESTSNRPIAEHFEPSGIVRWAALAQLAATVCSRQSGHDRVHVPA
jgi:hypothetical protein